MTIFDEMTLLRLVESCKGLFLATGISKIESQVVFRVSLRMTSFLGILFFPDFTCQDDQIPSNQGTLFSDDQYLL